MIDQEEKFLGPDRNLPATIVRKLCRLVTGKGSVAEATWMERQFIWDAMMRTNDREQSKREWRQRATGILIKEGRCRRGVPEREKTNG